MINFTDLPDKKRYVFITLWTKARKYQVSAGLPTLEELPLYVYHLEMKNQLLNYIGDNSALRAELGRVRPLISQTAKNAYEAVKEFDGRAVKDMARWIAKAEADYDRCLRDYNELKESINE